MIQIVYLHSKNFRVFTKTVLILELGSKQKKNNNKIFHVSARSYSL
jgi:hypothetical protein